MPDREVIRKLRTIVSLDVAGYSRLMGQDEEGTLATLQGHFRDLVEPEIAARRGRCVKTTGDGLLAEFASVLDAVQCCVEIQNAMAARNARTPAEQRIQFRIGINVGDVIVDGGDIFGDGVNIAARLEGIAEPGGICLSGAAHEQVRNKIAASFHDLGERALHNIETPVRAYRLAPAAPVPARAGAPSAGNAAEPGAAIAPPERPSVAIMAFRNLNGDPENDFIADGIGLGIQTLLVQLSGLFLMNATFDKEYRQGRVTAAEALRHHPVRFVLEGAVQRAGRRVRVTAKLTDLEANAVVWADRYDRDLEDVFALQDDVTREVIAALSVEILGGPVARIWTRDLAGDGAWEYFLRGLSHFYKYAPEENIRAREMFHRLYELRPTRSIGPSSIALSHWLDYARGWSDAPAEAFAKAREWAETAIDFAENNEGIGHAVMGSVRLVERAHDEALALCRHSLSLRANCPFTIGQLAAVQMYSGEPGHAIKTAREALGKRNFFPPQAVTLLAAAYRDNGDIPLSIPAAREAARIDPGHVDALITLCSDYAFQGMADEAAAVAKMVLDTDPSFRIGSFMARQPYRDGIQSDRIASALRAAGLPA